MRRQYQGIRTIQYLHKYTTTQSTNMTIISKKQVSSYLTSCFSLGADEFINCDLKGILHFHSSFSLSPAEKLLFLSQPMWTFLRVTKSCWENFESGLVCDFRQATIYTIFTRPHTTLSRFIGCQHVIICFCYVSKRVTLSFVSISSSYLLWVPSCRTVSNDILRVSCFWSCATASSELSPLKQEKFEHYYEVFLALQIWYKNVNIMSWASTESK